MTGIPDDTNELYGTLKGPEHPTDRATVLAAIRKVAAFADLSEADLT